jgi:hypothetical protein
MFNDDTKKEHSLLSDGLNAGSGRLQRWPGAVQPLTIGCTGSTLTQPFRAGRKPYARTGGQCIRKKTGERIPDRAPAGDFPEPVICPIVPSDGMLSTPIAAQTAIISRQRNLVTIIAHLRGQPNRTIFVVVRRQNSWFIIV